MDSKNNTKFKAGEKIFAKIRGWPYWPAVVDSIDTSMKITKYCVTFYGTGEVSCVKEIDCCSFLENKSRHGNSKNKGFHKAMKDAEKSFTNITNFNGSEHASLGVSDLKSNNSSLRDSPSAFSSPLLSKNNSPVNKADSYDDDLKLASVSCVLECQTSSTFHKDKEAEKINVKVVLKQDASVNTPSYLDEKFQLAAMTDRCISLEKVLLEERNEITRLKAIPQKSNQSETKDFHTQIILEELNKFKSENLNLQTTIQILQSENQELSKKLENLNLNKCMHCYPPLYCDERQTEEEWCFTKKYSNSTVASPSKISHFVQKNRFEILEDDDSALNADLTINDKDLLNSLANKTKNNLNNCHKRKNKSSSNHLIKVNKSDQKQLLIFADSHGKNLSNIIQQKTFDNVCSYVRPGARFDQVVGELKTISKCLTSKDHILVIAGTNNVVATGTKSLMDDIKQLYNNSEHTNLLLGTIPMRHDDPELDLEISIMNAEIEKFGETHKKHMRILPLHLLPRHLFTMHGLHLNKRGKDHVAKLVIGLLKERNDLKSEEQAAITASKKVLMNVLNHDEAVEKPEEETKVPQADYPRKTVNSSVVTNVNSSPNCRPPPPIEAPHQKQFQAPPLPADEITVESPPTIPASAGFPPSDRSPTISFEATAQILNVKCNNENQYGDTNSDQEECFLEDETFVINKNRELSTKINEIVRSNPVTNDSHDFLDL